MILGDGWYLFRCGRCGEAFVGSSMVEWCDCGNTSFNDGPRMGRINVEQTFGKSVAGCIAVWDHKEINGMNIPKKGLNLMAISKCLDVSCRDLTDKRFGIWKWICWMWAFWMEGVAARRIARRISKSKE